MKAYRSAGFTAVWRHMGGLRPSGIDKVPFGLRLIGYILGRLEPRSVKVICARTKAIDEYIQKNKPKMIVEIGAGYSTRKKRYAHDTVILLDDERLAHRDEEILPYQIGKKLNLDLTGALFIVEGVTMYLDQEQIDRLLDDIKMFRGSLLIDFFDQSKSRKEKTLGEKLYKFIFSLVTGRKKLFHYAIKNEQDGVGFLQEKGFTNVELHPLHVDHSLDTLYSAEF